MDSLRMMFVFGTRPEAIKMAPVVLAARQHPRITPFVCTTGQHREMLDQVNRYFGIIPDVDLNLMTVGQTLPDLTSRCLTSITRTIADQQPDCIVGQGDTTTALCAGIAAFYSRLPFIHVEAGLRTDSIHSPFPEEFNRRVCSLTTSLHCAPTETARQNLLKEGYEASRIVVTGNTVLDALRIAVSQERTNSLQWLLKHSYAAGQPMVLITAHRRENHGDGIRNLCLAIKILAVRFPGVQFVYPVHLNPNIDGPVREILNNITNVHLIPPADYPEFVWLMDQATLILSDSGGVQEEAPSLRKPVLVTRDSTERPEAVAAGANRLVGTNCDRIVQEVATLLTNREAYNAMQVDTNPYGDGYAANQIVELAVKRFLKTRATDIASSDVTSGI